MLNHETLYGWIFAEDWDAVLAMLYQERARIATEPLLRQAAHTFEVTFFEDLSGASADALERLFLLHTGGFYALAEDHFAALIARHRARPEVAAGYAGFCPEAPGCAEVLARHAARQPVPEAPWPTEEVAPLTDADHTQSLFKSQQERWFFQAVRHVFPTYLVYPNVALHAALDFEALREQLTPEERTYFFRALLDCAVFDQEHDYRPCFFFELDSPLHDDPERQARDAQKDRILALAGHRLYRVRPPRNPDPAAFVGLLKSLVARAER